MLKYMSLKLHMVYHACGFAYIVKCTWYSMHMAKHSGYGKVMLVKTIAFINY